MTTFLHVLAGMALMTDVIWLVLVLGERREKKHAKRDQGSTKNLGKDASPERCDCGYLRIPVSETLGQVQVHAEFICH